jgi:dCMP deaminase
VVCQRRYHAGGESEEMFRKVGLELHYIHDEIQEYEKAK